MDKKSIRVSDAIPEMPASFDRRTEETLKSVCAERSRKTIRSIERRPIRFNKKAWIAIAVAALLLVTTTAAVAVAIIRHNYYSPSGYMMHDKDEREQSGQTIPDVENAIASAKPAGGNYSIVMLPEMENADELNEWRQKMGQPVYSEEDWGWIREIRPEIEEVLVDGASLSFNVRLNTDHGMSFSYDRSHDGQQLDALCDAAYYTVLDTGTIGELSPGTGINPGSVSETGATLNTECDLDEPFPTDSIVRITMEIGVRDARVDDMGSIGLLAKITYTFEFDASAGADVAQPIITERPLSGSIVLTEFDVDAREYNKRVSLDGVVLEETVSYRSTGVYVTYKVKSAPESWTQKEKDALLSPSSDSGSLPGFFVLCAPKGSTDENEVIIPGKPSMTPPGEYTLILPIFPSDYEQIKKTGYELRVGFRCIDSFNDQPVGENWHFVLPDGVGEWDFTTSLQPIGVYELPLP